MITAYCAACRLDFEVEQNPPYAVVHQYLTDLDSVHLHPITREPLKTVVLS